MILLTCYGHLYNEHLTHQCKCTWHNIIVALTSTFKTPFDICLTHAKIFIFTKIQIYGNNDMRRTCRTCPHCPHGSRGPGTAPRKTHRPCSVSEWLVWPGFSSLHWHHAPVLSPQWFPFLWRQKLNTSLCIWIDYVIIYKAWDPLLNSTILQVNV